MSLSFVHNCNRNKLRTNFVQTIPYIFIINGWQTLLPKYFLISLWFWFWCWIARARVCCSFESGTMHSILCSPHQLKFSKLKYLILDRLEYSRKMRLINMNIFWMTQQYMYRIFLFPFLIMTKLRSKKGFGGLALTQVEPRSAEV